jgi:DNA-binding CsgD family transcriptional regulator
MRCEHGTAGARSEAEIAYELGIAPSTAHVSMMRAMSKLDLRSREERLRSAFLQERLRPTHRPAR